MSSIASIGKIREGPPAGKRFYRVPELVGVLGLTERQIRRGILAGTIHAQRHGLRSWLVPGAEVERLLRPTAEKPAAVHTRLDQALAALDGLTPAETVQVAHAALQRVQGGAL